MTDQTMTAVTPERGEGLKPCPLCGGEARLGLTNRVERKDTLSAFCVDCSCMLSRTGPPHSEATKRQVADAWNTRPTPSPVTDEVVGVLRTVIAALEASLDTPAVAIRSGRPTDDEQLADEMAEARTASTRRAIARARSLLATMENGE